MALVPVPREDEVEYHTPTSINSPALKALIAKEFKHIEIMEEKIADLRNAIKESVARMTGKGLHKWAIRQARARRKLLSKDGLEELDQSLSIICGVTQLGIQGDLFQAEEEERAAE